MADQITPLVQTYAVDFATNDNFLFIKGVQGDGAKTRYVDITLTNNGQPYTIDSSAVRVILRGTKPDGKMIFNTCQILDSSTIRAEITQQMSAVPGKGNYEISVMSLTTNQVLTSFPFYVMTSSSAFDIGYVTSSDEFTLLVEKINIVDQLDVDLRQTIDKSETQTDLANTATANANAAAAAAEAATKAADTATVNARNATQEALNRIDEYDALNFPEKYQKMLDATAAGEVLNRQTEDTLEYIDSLDLGVVTQNAINATQLANTAAQNAIEQTAEAKRATDAADNATADAIDKTAAADKATADAIEAAERALLAAKAVEDGLGIADEIETLSTVWSSKKTADTIRDSLHKRLDDITIYPSDWVNHKVYIMCEDITSNSVIDIYFTNDTLRFIDTYEISYSHGDGYICLEAKYDPKLNLEIMAILIVNTTLPTTATVSGIDPN